MKPIGLIGGMSWESTAEYYRIINETVARHAGGLSSAECMLYSVNFAGYAALMEDGDWDEIGTRVGDIALTLKRAGMEAIAICTNTMHKVASHVEAAAGLPLIHIADVTADALVRDGRGTAGLLGTRFTMEEEFYRLRLRDKGVDTVVPPPEDRADLDRIIFDELCRGTVSDISREVMLRIIGGLADSGADSVILGCTELPLLLGDVKPALTVYDTTDIHARAIAEYMMDE